MVLSKPSLICLDDAVVAGWAGPGCAWNGCSGCMAREVSTHLVPTAPQLPHQRTTPEPNLTWKFTVQSTCIIWCSFQLLLSADQPLVPRLVLLLVPSGGLMCPRHRHCPSSSRAGLWCHQQWNRDMGHVLHQFGPIIDLPCCLHLGDGAKDSGVITLRPGHHPQHPTSFAWERPALDNKSRCSSSKATLMSLYPTCRDINNLKNRENT